MIRAVFFDFYGTLARFDPPGEVIQATVLREFGLSAAPEALRRGYAFADDFMARENGRDPVARRPPEQRDAFFAEYERVLLEGAGVHADRDLSSRVWQRVAQVPRNLALFDDVTKALTALRAQGLVLGVLSNLERDVGELTARLGIRQYLTFWITSREVGHTKPHPAVFQAALLKAGVGPGEALHVGDQYHSDVAGARALGIQAVLLDRAGVLPAPPDCVCLRSLTELISYIQEAPGP